MEPSLFELIDRAMELGGKDLTPAKLKAKEGTPAAAALAQLQQQGLLSEGKKIQVTEAGSQAWEKEAPAERKADLKEREREAGEASLLAFIQDFAAGKLPKKAPPEIVERAISAQLIHKEVEGTKKKKTEKLVLLPAAHSFLLRRELATLRQGFRELTSGWQTLREKLEKDLQSLLPQGTDSPTDLHDRSEQARAGFEDALRELTSFTHLVEAGHRLKSAVEHSTEGDKGRLEEEASRQEALEKSLRESLTAHKETFDAFSRRFEERTAELEARLTSLPAAPTATPPAQESAVDEGQVWDAFKKAYEEQRAETSRMGGIVKIPELTDAVCKEVAGLSRDRFHELLKRWQDQDRIHLQICNDPRLEPRASEGIESSRGLLYFVKLT